MEQNAVDRLANKSPEAAVTDQISRDLHRASFMAPTYFEQMQEYFEQYLNQQRDIGQARTLRGGVAALRQSKIHRLTRSQGPGRAPDPGRPDARVNKVAKCAGTGGLAGPLVMLSSPRRPVPRAGRCSDREQSGKPPLEGSHSASISV